MHTNHRCFFRFTILLLAFTAGAAARADGSGGKGECPGKDCEPREVCFNLVCNYRNVDLHDSPDSHESPRACQVAAQFVKYVTHEGEELEDSSVTGDNPRFEVSCDGDTIFNDHGHRFTTRLGTRIQALTGPFPAVLLPRDTLSDVPHYALSTLELGTELLRGSCFVYPGAP